MTDYSVAFFMLGIALILLVLFSPAIISSFRGESFGDSDYQSCLNKCPISFGGTFKDYDCPRMCLEVLNKTIIYPCNNLSDVVR